MLFAVSIKRLP